MGSREKRQDLITNYLQIEDEGEKRVKDDSKGSLSDGLENSSITEKNEGGKLSSSPTLPADGDATNPGQCHQPCKCAWYSLTGCAERTVAQSVNKL